MEKDGKVQEYIEEAENWLSAAKASKEESSSASAYNALHSAELAAKASLIQKTGKDYRTHNIAGEFAKYFRDRLGKDICKELSKKMTRYSTIRYPGEKVNPTESREMIDFAEKFLRTVRKEVVK